MAHLAAMVDRFCTALDCVEVGFLPDGTLDHLPLPSRIGATRVGGIDFNRPRMRRVLAAMAALSAAPRASAWPISPPKVQSMTAESDGYTVRQAAYDLRKLRAKALVAKPGRSHRYHVPPRPHAPSLP